MPIEKKIYQLKVSLTGSVPSIWRRILIPGTTTLQQLHDIIQIVMGWEDCHLHMFTINGQIYGDPEQDPDGEMGANDEGQLKLNQAVGEGSKFSYEYDFGDSWQHDLTVERILPAEKGERYPLCAAGERACPPEDAGGIGGYEDFLQAIADPKHPEHSNYLEWAGGSFDAEQFDLEKVNDLLVR